MSRENLKTLGSIIRTLNLMLGSLCSGPDSNDLSPLFLIWKAVNSGGFTSEIMQIFVMDIEKNVIPPGVKMHVISKALEEDFFLEAVVMSFCTDMVHSLSKGSSFELSS